MTLASPVPIEINRNIATHLKTKKSHCFLCTLKGSWDHFWWQVSYMTHIEFNMHSSKSSKIKIKIRFGERVKDCKITNSAEWIDSNDTFNSLWNAWHLYNYALMRCYRVFQTGWKNADFFFLILCDLLVLILQLVSKCYR